MAIICYYFGRTWVRRFFKKTGERSIIFWGNVVLLLLVIALAGISLLSARRILLENAQKTGEEIAKSYRMEEERNLELYRALLTVGSQYVEGMVKRGEDETRVTAWLEDYFIKLTKTTGMERVVPRAVVNGRVLAVGPHSYEEIDAGLLTWYEEALKGDGEIVYTDVYTDSIYNKPVITMAKECGDKETVIAFDVFAENFRIYDNSQILPEGSVYFLCDAKGSLLYDQISPDREKNMEKSTIHDLYLRIQTDEFVNPNHFYYTPEGDIMSVYYKEEPNGWMSVLLIPNSYLMERWEKLIGRYLGIFMLILLIIAFMWMRQKRTENSKKRIDETVQILGNHYYAFYRINIEKETYEMIKGAEYVKEVLSPRGRYEDLLDIFEKLIKEDAYDEFLEKFSIRNVREQIENGITDFGGDFRRIFENQWRWVNVHILYAPSISKDEAVLCFREVEEEKQRQLRQMSLLEDSLKAAHASDESQKRFFSGISHDMRTPLNIIIGMSEVAGKCAEDTERVKNYLQKIHYSSKQLLGLINHILEVSRLDQGMYLQNESFNIREKVARSVDAFEVQAKEEKKELHFTYNIKHEEVRGDITRLYQIVSNLLSNAMSFTKEGDSITVALNEIYNQEYTRYQIIVSDTGAGMSQKVKERFCQSDIQKSGFDSNDTGELGLMIVKNVVSLMNGEINIESALGEGTAVTVTLPFERPDLPKNEETKKADEEEFTLEGRRILLAEDYELNRELATDILTMCKAAVVPAKNGKEALDIFAASDEFSFDAILMDMQMPVMDGCQAAEKIRSLDRADAGIVPIVAVTANTFAEDISRTTKAGMNAHIAKPIDIRILCTTLMELLGGQTEKGNGR